MADRNIKKSVTVVQRSMVALDKMRENLMTVMSNLNAALGPDAMPLKKYAKSVKKVGKKIDAAKAKTDKIASKKTPKKVKKIKLSQKVAEDSED